MPSVLPGFEYDIFISYRQKDNRYDGWVTEFVTNLRKELEATFKEDISIYFDENPHDGLLESHDVNRSLEGKLKCLIFIPILSQTYCDPKSFAWTNEFVVFNAMALGDQFGRDIRLANGNVASRILPIRVHELDAGDREIFEKETGSVLRPIDFIFKSAGVNRPLRANEEDIKANLNHQVYRNQINKVANAVKDIVLALKSPDLKTRPRSTHAPHVAPHSQAKRIGFKWIVAGIGLVAAVLLFIYFIRKPAAATSPGQYDVAVMYLENFTDKERYGDELASLIHINLAGDSTIRVLPRQRLFDEMQEATGEARLPDRAHASGIASKTGSKTMITGSVHQAKDEVLVQIELVDVASGKILKTEKMSGVPDQIFDLADKICEKIAGKALHGEFNITLHTTDNYKAYEEFYAGQEDFWVFKFGSANKHFEEAIRLDSTFALGYLYLSQSMDVTAPVDVFSDLRPAQALIAKAKKYSYRLNDTDKKILEMIDAHYHGDQKKAFEVGMAIADVSKHERIALLYTSAMASPHSELIAKYEKLNPTVGFVFNQAAYSASSIGDCEHATRSVQRYCALEMQNGNAYQSGWEIFLVCDKPAEALKYIDTLTSRFKSTHVVEWKGLHYLALGEANELLQLYNLNRNSLPNDNKTREFESNALVLLGKFKSAIKKLDELSRYFEQQNNWELAFEVNLHKGIVMFESHDIEGGLQFFKNYIAAAHGRFENKYNPYVCLAHFYQGIFLVRANRVAEAEQQLLTIHNLIESKANDSRFRAFEDLLDLEIRLAKGTADDPDNFKNSNLIPISQSNIDFAHLKAAYHASRHQFDRAIQTMVPFHKYMMTSRTFYGGDQTFFACERAFSDYHTAWLYQQNGQKENAIRYYKIFLERFKDADPGIPEKVDAEKKLSSLMAN